MSTALIDYCKSEIEALKEARTFKKERVLEGPTGARVRVDGREVLMCAGIDPNERTVKGMMDFVRRGVRTSVALSREESERQHARAEAEAA